MFKFWKNRKKSVNSNEVIEQKSDKLVNIRDFLYLDVERVKSIYAQLEKGLVTGKEKIEGKTKEVSGKGGGEINTLFSLTAEGKFIWENEERETKTLHDYIYNYIESKLCNNNSIVFVDSSTVTKDWLNSQLGKFNIDPNSFILIRGRINLDDYDYLKRILNNFNKLSEFIIRSAHSQPSKLENKSQNKNVEHLKKYTLDKELVEGLKHFFDTFYAGRCMVSVCPNVSIPTIYFTGHIIKTFIRDGLESVIFRYGTSPQIIWNVFAQVAYIPSGVEIEKDNELPLSGNPIDKALQITFNATRELEKIATGVSYPAISIIPIAIYR